MGSSCENLFKAMLATKVTSRSEGMQAALLLQSSKPSFAFVGIVAV